MSLPVHKLATALMAGALLVSTSASAAAPGWPAGFAKAAPPPPAGKAHTLATGVSGFAVVRAADGSVQWGSNVIGVTHVAPGAFLVQFNSNVARCAYNATIGDPSAQSSPPPIGMASVVNFRNQSGDPSLVVVETADPSGTLADLNFHLTVTC